MKLLLILFLTTIFVCSATKEDPKAPQKFVKEANLTADIEEFLKNKNLAVVLYRNSVKKGNEKKDKSALDLEMANLLKEESAEVENVDDNLGWFNKLKILLKNPSDIFKPKDEKITYKQEKTVAEKIMSRMEKYQIPLIAVDAKDEEFSGIVAKNEIKTLPLVMMYKDSELVLREVPSLATVEKIYRAAFGIRREDAEDFDDNGLYF
ncbi:unnamed protein product [Moneuplotes crassus]|uniref:Uncharacterized protein n=1 Tax=Euplotes crassus TaxID=5936 RepID=A0AAD1XT97_EUPCR|nr:unnamed protein product [Moneuplotes crassus]